MARRKKTIIPEPEYVNVTLDTGKTADVHPDTLAQIKRLTQPGDVWFAYRNEALDSAQAGHVVFLVCGPGRTFTDREKMPDRAPDGPHGAGWKYVRLGWFDPASV